MPYIPKEHEKYDLLPRCRKSGGEVFEYPSSLLNKIEKMLGNDVVIFPYNYESYEEYYALLEDLAVKHSSDSAILELLQQLKTRMQELNCKEDWSVLKYIGPTDNSCLGLTCGKNYYWPTRRNNPVYCGVVDDEEFTAYLYPTANELWEILEDPTGMAYNTIYNNGKGALSIKEYDHIMAQLSDTTGKDADIDNDFSGAEE